MVVFDLEMLRDQRGDQRAVFRWRFSRHTVERRRALDLPGGVAILDKLLHVLQFGGGGGSIPPIASTIEHIGESRLDARDQSCIRPAIGTQTPWHDIHWFGLSLGTSEAFGVRIYKRSPGVLLLIKTM